ncbi:hypothetical protein Tcan_14462 [Toxocara canis]|uniref:Uncharacterized protein n=1 Tax=Toxocara canis TaxID=6265 RepID=A0A0B2VJH3_TOXCA|nr:hypothetical protein Tcan_14462 [Toxocara canis]
MPRSLSTFICSPRRFAKKVEIARKGLWFSTGSWPKQPVGQANDNFLSFVTASERQYTRLGDCLLGLHLQNVGDREELCLGRFRLSFVLREDSRRKSKSRERASGSALAVGPSSQ